MTTIAQRLKLSAWYQAVRPRVFTASYVPMGVVAALAIQDGAFRSIPFFLALIGTMLLQTGANLVNEYADYRKGADELKQAGQGMAIKDQVLSPDSILRGAVVSLVLGAVIGLYLLWQSGPLLWGIGIGGVLVAIIYTAGPFPLAYNGLGEVAAGIFMGPMIVVGGYYVMQPDISNQKLLELVVLSFPIMFMTAAILHANNIRDMDADRAVNKRTLAVLLGLRWARVEYMFLVWVTYISQIVLVLVGLMPAATLVTLITLPEAQRLIHIFNTSDDVKLLHQAQGRTAKLHGQMGLLVFVSWIVYLLVRSWLPL